MKYPFLLAALLLCSANLAARHPDTDTLLQPDTLSLRQSDAHTVHGSDSLGMRRSDSLRQSDALSAQKSDEFYRGKCDYELSNTAETPEDFREIARDFFRRLIGELREEKNEASR